MRAWDELSERRERSQRHRIAEGLAQMRPGATVFDRTTDVRVRADATGQGPEAAADRRENGRGKTDVENAAALDAIAALLDGREWDGADLAIVADLVRRTGREIASPLPDGVLDLPVPNREVEA